MPNITHDTHMNLVAWTWWIYTLHICIYICIQYFTLTSHSDIRCIVVITYTYIHIYTYIYVCMYVCIICIYKHMIWCDMIWYEIAFKNIIRIIYWLEHAKAAKGISEVPHNKCQVNAGLCCSQSWAILLTDACGGHALVWGVLQTSLSTNSRTGSQLLSSLISFFGTWNILSPAIERPGWLESGDDFGTCKERSVRSGTGSCTSRSWCCGWRGRYGACGIGPSLGLWALQMIFV